MKYGDDDVYILSIGALHGQHILEDVLDDRYVLQQFMTCSAESLIFKQQVDMYSNGISTLALNMYAVQESKICTMMYSSIDINAVNNWGGQG